MGAEPMHIACSLMNRKQYLITMKLFERRVLDSTHRLEGRGTQFTWKREVDL
jgi:hypothetical protein